MAHERSGSRDPLDDGIAVWVRRRIAILSSALSSGFDLDDVVARTRRDDVRFEFGAAEQAAEIKAFRMGQDGEVEPAIAELLNAAAATTDAPAVSIADRQTARAAIVRLTKAAFLDPTDDGDRPAFERLTAAFMGQWPWLGGADPYDEA